MCWALNPLLSGLTVTVQLFVSLPEALDAWAWKLNVAPRSATAGVQPVMLPFVSIVAPVGCCGKDQVIGGVPCDRVSCFMYWAPAPVSPLPGATMTGATWAAAYGVTNSRDNTETTTRAEPVTDFVI